MLRDFTPQAHLVISKLNFCIKCFKLHASLRKHKDYQNMFIAHGKSYIIGVVNLHRTKITYGTALSLGHALGLPWLVYCNKSLDLQ